MAPSTSSFIRLLEKRLCSEFLRLLAQTRLFARGQKNKGRGLGQECLDALRHREAIARWKRDIEQSQIGLEFDGRLNRSRGVRRDRCFVAAMLEANGKGF